MDEIKECKACGYNFDEGGRKIILHGLSSLHNDDTLLHNGDVVCGSCYLEKICKRCGMICNGGDVLFCEDCGTMIFSSCGCAAIIRNPIQDKDAVCKDCHNDQ